MTIRRTPQIRDYVSFPQCQSSIRDFLREVAEDEGLSISDVYIIGAVSHWSNLHPTKWKRTSRGSRRDEFLKAIGR